MIKKIGIFAAVAFLCSAARAWSNLDGFESKISTQGVVIFQVVLSARLSPSTNPAEGRFVPKKVLLEFAGEKKAHEEFEFAYSSHERMPAFAGFLPPGKWQLKAYTIEAEINGQTRDRHKEYSKFRVREFRNSGLLRNGMEVKPAAVNFLGKIHISYQDKVKRRRAGYEMKFSAGPDDAEKAYSRLSGFISGGFAPAPEIAASGVWPDDFIRMLNQAAAVATSGVPVLLNRLKEPKQDDKIAAIKELEAKGAAAKSALPALRELVNDKNEAVRQAAWQAMETISVSAEKSEMEGMDKGTRHIASIIRDRAQDESVRVGYINNLADYNIQTAAPLFNRIAGDLSEPPAVRQAAKDALKKLAASSNQTQGTMVEEETEIDFQLSGIPAMISGIKNKKSSTHERVVLITALGNMGPKAEPAIKFLRGLVENKSEPKQIRTAAKAAIKQISPSK